MQYLLMCEGPNEKGIIDLLIDSKKLIISREDLLNRSVFVSRQIAGTPAVQTALRTYNGPIEIWRIGDTLNDVFEIPEEFKRFITKNKIRKICTKPEIEILLIIDNNLLKEFNKVKSKEKAKVFAKKEIILNGKNYDNRTDFWINYYSGKRISNLISNIKTYKQVKRNNKIKKEEYLADILK